MTEQAASPKASCEDAFITVNDLRLHYLEWNPAGSDTLVLLHGLNVQAHTWDPIAEDLARDYRVIALDLRGHGLSGWATDGYYLSNFVSDLAAVVDALGLPAFHLVTHSLGCRIGIIYAAHHPDRVLSLSLSDAGPEVPRQAAQFTQRVVGAAGGARRGFRTEEEAAEFYREMHPEWRPEFIELHARHQLRRNWANKLVYRADPDLFWLTGSASSRDDGMVWAKLAAVSAPTLILWGTRSPFFNEDIATRMLDRLQDGRLVRTDTGQYIPRENPEEFLRRVRDFIAPELTR
jgi:pimeloyl-ACP methyl ester carboxylesterase